MSPSRVIHRYWIFSAFVALSLGLHWLMLVGFQGMLIVEPLPLEKPTRFRLTMVAPTLESKTLESKTLHSKTADLESAPKETSALTTLPAAIQKKDSTLSERSTTPSEQQVNRSAKQPATPELDRQKRHVSEVADAESKPKPKSGVTPKAKPANLTQSESYEDRPSSKLEAATVDKKSQPTQQKTPLSKPSLPALKSLNDVQLASIDAEGLSPSQGDYDLLRYVRLMEAQLEEKFVKPADIPPGYSGQICISLSDTGLLTEAYVCQKSGHPQLDRVSLAAVNAVGRFKVPESRILAARYFSTLRLNFDSD